jgi:hypothetical protein
MSNDRPWHALFRTPAELRANRRMPDESVAASADERAPDRCAVADVRDITGTLSDISYSCAYRGTREALAPGKFLPRLRFKLYSASRLTRAT